LKKDFNDEVFNDFIDYIVIKIGQSKNEQVEITSLGV